MAGIHLLEMLGALIRWSLFGFKKSYKFYLKDKKNESVIPRNFFTGVLTFFTILFLIWLG